MFRYLKINRHISFYSSIEYELAHKDVLTGQDITRISLKIINLFYFLFVSFAFNNGNLLNVFKVEIC